MSIEQFSLTTYMLNNQLAELTWQRKRWADRIESAKHILVEKGLLFSSPSTSYTIFDSRLNYRDIVCKTLSQMEF